MDNVFAYDVALNIMQGNEDLEPYPSKNVDKDMIGQNGKKQFNQN